ncbi:MAG: hypothetical protein ACQETR_02985 [Thermodesulfobacteriota bacterium]
MATLTGDNLLGSIIESSGVELNILIHATLTAKLQQMIDNHTYSKLAAGIAMSGFSTEIRGTMNINQLSNVIETNSNLIADAEEGEVDQIDFPSEVTSVDIDTGTLETPASFDADDGAYNFIDDASVLNNVEISNFTSDDSIAISNATVEDYAFSNDGSDVNISYNNSGTINMITLIGVVTSDDLIYDQDTFEAAVGFDAFAV